MKKSRILAICRIVFVCLIIGGCAGVERGCSSFGAANFGSDWVIVQYGCDGSAINAWKLSNTSVDNEGQSDGIYWLDSQTKHLVHISGWYNRVQVSGGEFEEAARLLGVEYSKIANGAYPKE